MGEGWGKVGEDLGKQADLCECVSIHVILK